MSAVEELTLQVKKTDQRIKMIDQATKGATGILLAAMPGAALLGKIRTLIADSIKLHRRRKSLNKWSREMNEFCARCLVRQAGCCQRLYRATGGPAIQRCCRTRGRHSRASHDGRTQWQCRALPV